MILALQGAPKTALVAQPPAVLEPAPGNPVAVISTSMGDITVELFKDRAPVSVENFLRYVTEGFYPGTIFHRVVKGFVVQGAGTCREWSRNRPTIRFRTRPPTA